MCEKDFQDKQLAALSRIEKLLDTQINGRDAGPEDQTYVIGNSQSNLILNYKGRKHLYLFAGVGLTLNLNDIGTLVVAANTWTDISFRPGMQLFTTNQATPVAVLVRATNEIVTGAGNGSAAAMNLTQIGGNAVVTGGASGLLGVGGNVASGTTDSGNPVEIGGQAHATAPAGVSDGQRVVAWFGHSGQIAAALVDINGATASINTAGDQQGFVTGPGVVGQTMYYTGGGNWDRGRTPNIFKTIQAASITAGTPVSVWTPTSGKKFRVMGYVLSLSVAGAILFEDTTGGANEFWRTALLAAGIGVPSPNLGNGHLSLAANNVLYLDVTATGTVSGFIYGIEE